MYTYQIIKEHSAAAIHAALVEHQDDTIPSLHVTIITEGMKRKVE